MKLLGIQGRDMRQH